MYQITKKKIAEDIIRSLLILLFTYASVSKLSGMDMFRSQLTKFPVLGNYSLFFSWFIPCTELYIVVLLLIPKFQVPGFYASVILLSIFTVFLILMVSFSINLPCSCGGIIAKLSWKQHIVFNLFFLALSATGIYLKKRPAKFHTPQKTKTLRFSA